MKQRREQVLSKEQTTRAEKETKTRAQEQKHENKSTTPTAQIEGYVAVNSSP
jgi:hypothetical protein